MNKDVRQLVRQLTAIPGVTIDQSGPHLKVLRDGVYLVTMPKTPSDHRWRENTLRQLRAKGLTPPSKVAPEAVVGDELPIEQLRDELLSIFKILGNQADFARFTLEVADVLGIEGYKNFRSAEVSLVTFKKGGNPAPEKRILLEESLRMWRQRNASLLRASRAAPVVGTDVVQHEPGIEESKPGCRANEDPSQPAESLTLTIDLETLNGLLRRIGIQLEPGFATVASTKQEGGVSDE